VADELLRRYGLGSPLKAEVVSSGLLNQNLTAVTARGSFFLKGYRYPDPARIEREHRLIAYVAGRGLPAVAPLPAPGGATFLRVGGRLWAVFDLLRDAQYAPPALTAAHAAEMGRTLGRLHAALAELPPPEAARFPPKLLWDSARAAAEMAAYEAAIARRPALDPFDQHALASFAYRRTLLAAGVPPPSAFAGLPAHLLHGDYHERNLFFGAGGAVSGIVDWELAGAGPRAWEIIRTLDVALELSREFEAGGARWRAFLAAYAAEAPLTYDECTAMPELYWAARVHSLWVYEEHYRRAPRGLPVRTDRVAMEDIAGLEWWLRHRTDLALALADAVRGARPRLRVMSDE
jgi:Ser/Thr protein kinase RdoA (MazF antagonist)